MAYMRSEQETSIVWDEEEKVARIWTASPVSMRKLDRLCELDETPLDPTRKNGMQFYQVFVSPVFNL